MGIIQRNECKIKTIIHEDECSSLSQLLSAQYLSLRGSLHLHLHLKRRTNSVPAPCVSRIMKLTKVLAFGLLAMLVVGCAVPCELPPLFARLSRWR